MKEFCALRAKTCSYLIDDNSEVKKDTFIKYFCTQKIHMKQKINT